jgi:adhesin/invasin
MIIGAPHPYRHGKPWLIATVTALLLALSTAACGKKKSSDDAEPATEAPVTPPTGGDQPGTDDGGSGGDGGAGDPDPVVKPPKPVVPSATYSEIEVSAPSVAAGQAVTLKVVAMSAANVPYTQGGATVAFSRTGGTSNGSISAVTDHGDGTYTAVFSATTAGTATTINALFNGKPITTTAPTVTVTYGAVSAANSVLLSDLSVIASGDIAELTLTTYDAHGNAVTSGGAAVTLGHAGGTSTGNFGTITDNGDGSYSAFFTGVTAGSATSIIAEIDGQPIGGAPVAITVLPGAVSLAQSSVSVSDATVQAGATSTLTLTARDDAGNQLTSGGMLGFLFF